MSAHNAREELHSESDGSLVDPGDGGDIQVDANLQVLHIVTGGAETRTLKDPTAAGTFFMMVMKTDGGDCVVTADTAINAAGNTTITFDDVRDHILLVSVEYGSGDLRWESVAATASLS